MVVLTKPVQVPDSVGLFQTQLTPVKVDKNGELTSTHPMFPLVVAFAAKAIELAPAPDAKAVGVVVYGV